MSCLFDSLSRFVEAEDINGISLRTIICNYLSTNPSLLLDTEDLRTIIFIETGLEVDAYINQMRKQSTFGGAIEIRAFTKIFKLNVCVKSVPNNKRIEFIENPQYRWCVLVWTGNHYDASDEQLIVID